MVITSVNNERIKEISKLKEKKYRDSTGTFLIEGEHLLLEAYKSNLVKEVFVLEGNNIDIDVPRKDMPEILKWMISMFLFLM